MSAQPDSGTTPTGAGAETEEPDQPGTVAPTVLATLYDELRDSLDQQLGQIDRLNERAQQLFGFAGVILAIIAAATPRDMGLGTRIAFVAAMPLFGLAAAYAALAWRLESWRGDPNVEVLWTTRRTDAEEHFRYQVIHNRLDSIRKNEIQIAAKSLKVKRAHFWLYCGFLYIAVLVAVRLLA